MNLNYFPVSLNNPGSEDWIDSQLAYYKDIIERQVREEAAQRGIDPNSPIVEDEINRQLNEVRQKLSEKASEYQFTREENEKNRQAQEKMMKEQNKAQERASLWAGLGQIGGNILLNPYIGKTPAGSLVSKGFNEIKNIYKPKETSSLPPITNSNPSLDLVNQTKPSIFSEQTKPSIFSNQTSYSPKLSSLEETYSFKPSLSHLSNNNDITTSPSNLGGNWTSLQKTLGTGLGSGLGYFLNPAGGRVSLPVS